jgi:exonuclease SbcC
VILERLVLENFKQFRERVELSPPEGAIGVVGRNGSGKTTIFESMLWAFFGSRRDPRFSNDSIPWSGGMTAERTSVEVTLNLSGTPYTVARTLQRGKTEARIYDDSGEEIVGGPSEVAGWVQENLLGMDRVAFEATFFARQKELEFFAGVTGVERQREIARILSIDQVEEAQKLLRTDRKDLRNEVSALESILEGVNPEGLVEELEEAREEHTGLEVEAATLRERLEVAEQELATARAEGKKLETVYRQHNELRSTLATTESGRERATERSAKLRETLAGLDEDEKTVGELLPRTQKLATVVKEIEALEEARRRHERREAAEQGAQRRQIEAQRAVIEASNLLESLDGTDDEPLPGWSALSRCRGRGPADTSGREDP